MLLVAEYMLDILECIWDHRAEYDPDDREAWKAYIEGVFANSPALRGLYEEFSAESWYPALDDALGMAGRPAVSTVPLNDESPAPAGLP